MNRPARHGTTPRRTAVYLRCYPADRWQVDTHLTALRRFAHRLRLGQPDEYIDNGYPSGGPLPELGRMLNYIATGVYATVLVTGPFVFSLSDTQAERTVRRIHIHCCRVVELPSPRADATSIRTVEPV
ncbi:recombinase family protein [Streptomyces sp. H10-C2]|uniref:recombinase family protein n=1 Tax=unclassified Streptomyces TaxID=2593676 RepID=UPI0024BAF1F4|nr:MULTISPECIES: recombinase family protein [unclassified Streptomyces]MDJ0343443.1 recombinase family protein [Streptomyces sp. PH10-H1]MDJ0371523.1 recombinase family protein [Streptomyces sp. H10-C2]